jgi:glycosyltransferase involved in cell wall biosynthesis
VKVPYGRRSRGRRPGFLKVAYFSPMPPERSGIADYSALLVPALRKRVDLLVPRRGRRRPSGRAHVSVYHIGNNPDAHAWILDVLRRKPGLVVLHDFVLHHLIAGVTIGRRDGHGYLNAMERENGVVGRLLGHGVLDKRIPPLWENRPEEFPLTGEVLDLATGLIVHSEYVRDRARAAGYEGPISVIPHPAWRVPAVEAIRPRPGLVIGAFGNVNASKRVPQLLAAFAQIRRARPDATLLLVGATSPGFDLERRLQRHGIDPAGLVREDWVSEQRLWGLMRGADIHVNLRAPTMGETSGTAVRALALGKPLVVSDTGWFAELPDSVALKVPVDDRETETLAAGLELLAARPEVRASMGSAARELAETEHELEQVADLYVRACEEAAGGPKVADAVLGEVAAAAAAVGIEPGGEGASEIARRLAEVELHE